MLLLLGCVMDRELKPVEEDPFSDGHTDEPDTVDTDVPDTGDTAADTDDSAVTTDDTGGTDTDTGPAVEPCVPAGATHPLSIGSTTVSPYASQLVEDLDGGGLPDLLYETWRDGRGIALVRGEAIATGDYTATRWFPATSLTDQAAYGVGPAGDLDEDGIGELAVTHALGSRSSLALWSSGDGSAPTATIAFEARFDHGVPLASEAPGPDLDGDGVPELLVTVGGDRLGEGAAFVYDGAGLGAGGSYDEGDAALVVREEAYVFGDPVATTDLDGDGVRDILLNRYTETGVGDVRLLPAELAAFGGILSYEDLQALVRPGAGTKTPLLVDLDEDGQEELFVPDLTVFDRAYGYSGADVAAAVRDGHTLANLDASVVLLAGGRDYLGGDIVPVSDADCGVGLALSAHFANEVVLVSNATLRAGGTVLTDEGPRFDGGHWYGYATAGGQDLDGDGTLDLFAAGDDGNATLYLAPWDAVP